VDKALPPDADEFVRPRRALLLLIGPLVGLLVACLVIALATRPPPGALGRGSRGRL
jgi:hypothetical protein